MNEGFILPVKRLSPLATLPVRATPGAAGYDLSAAASIIVPSKSRAMVYTGLSVAIPTGYFGLIKARSSLSTAKYCIDVAAGVIDSDYRGPVGVILVNNGAADFPVEVGDRIAQMVLLPVGCPVVVEVVAGELDETQRGEGGFGSTGRGGRVDPGGAGIDSAK